MGETVDKTAMWGYKWERIIEPGHIRNREINAVGGCNCEKFYSCYMTKEVEQRCWDNAIVRYTQVDLLF